MTLTLTTIAGIAIAAFWIQSTYSEPTFPNPLDLRRGKCLDAAWVANVSSHLDLSARDELNRKMYPIFRPALQSPRFIMKDPRQYQPNAFAPDTICARLGDTILGVGARVYANGTTANRGRFRGTFTLEFNSWDSHYLTTAAMAILVQEVVGYDISYITSSSGVLAAERMSSVRAGLCSPTHANMETWPQGKLEKFAEVANETSFSIVGYNGLSGMYTLARNVKEGLEGVNSTMANFTVPYYADFWRDYASEEMVAYYSKNNSNAKARATEKYCANITQGGKLGCMGGCSKTKACTLYEAMGKSCLTIAMMVDYYDPGFLQAITDNNNVPAYHCFMGWGGMQKYVEDIAEQGGVVAFYHYEPDVFHFQHENKFVRVAWPRSQPEIIKMNTASYGELGYGQGTTNPVNVDFPDGPLYKYYSSALSNEPMLNSLVERFTISPLDMNTMLRTQVANSNDPSITDPHFTTACAWVKANFNTWRAWIDRLPLCTIKSHIQWTYTGCSNESTSRNITFVWNVPDPSDAKQPYNCDGGLPALPETYVTSRTCEWLQENEATWMQWLTTSPTCDVSFYTYTISPCTKTSIRNVVFSWLLPNENGTASRECINGVSLPSSTTINCDFVPANSNTAASVLAGAIVVIIFLSVIFIMVVRFRDRPVIKRAQWPLLLTLLVGAIVMCVYVIIGAGAPTSTLCALRPILVSIGFTVTFGSIVVKSLRVYLVFNQKAMKKIQVKLSRMFRTLAILVAVDILIVGVWLIADFPAPTTTIVKATEFVGTADHVECKSSSFIFTALTIFWKAIVLFSGLYLSFLIRHADADFQESTWIFASACVILITSIIMLPLAYLVNLPPAIDYSFRSATILISTVLLVCLMFGPKFARLNSKDTSVATTNGTAGGASVKNSKTSLSRTDQPQGSFKMASRPGPYERTRRTCFDENWVATTAAAASLNPKERDPTRQGVLVNPLLRPSLKSPRFKMHDPRQKGAYNPSCIPSTHRIHGIGEILYANGTVADRGKIEGTVTLEIFKWISHTITTNILSILIQEMIGFDVSILDADDGINSAERMSSVGKGLCMPTHANVEVWTDGKLIIYSNETTSSSLGYTGYAGVYTLTSNIETALLGRNAPGGIFSRSYSADFWREYTQTTELADFFSIQNTHNLSKIARREYCPDGVMGCKNGCEKNDACTAAEAKGNQCVLVAMMTPGYDPGYIQAILSNNNIPAYFCFGGYDGMMEYILETMNHNGTILFYHFEPEPFHIEQKGKLSRITFPPSDPERVALATGTFGELGYGNKTTNPVDVEFPESTLMKYYPDLLYDENEALYNLMSKFQITTSQMNDILSTYSTAKKDTTIIDPVFDTACTWLRNNLVWWTWIDPLPLCTLSKHITHTINGCGDKQRNISFAWNDPNPLNNTEPYTCDGGLMDLPNIILTSKSCEWLDENYDTWKTWINGKPKCDQTHYNYTITSCDEQSNRHVGFFWLIPSLLGGSFECTDGIVLPGNTSIPCDYVPATASVYHSVMALSIVLMIFLVILFTLVLIYRERPIIKRSQWPLLLLILTGGIILCIDVIFGVGEPSDFLCGSQPLLDSLAFSVLFTAILIKSLRVFLLFNNKSMKKVTVSLWKMLKFYFLIVGIDLGIVLTGLLFDFPHPSISISKATTFVGTIDHIQCKSSGFIFTALSGFWKFIIVATGLYLAFLIRHADSDFQETIWIVASSVVVVVGGLILLPIAYFVSLPPPTAYVVRSMILLIGMLFVVGFMIAPKLFKLSRTSTSDKSKPYKTSTTNSSIIKVNGGKNSSQNKSEIHDENNKQNTSSKN